VGKVAEGRSTRVTLEPEALRHVEVWVSFYRAFWTERVGRLEKLLEKMDQ